MLSQLYNSCNGYLRFTPTMAKFDQRVNLEYTAMRLSFHSQDGPSIEQATHTSLELPDS